MDLDLLARAGARFKPKGRPQPKKKQVSLSTLPAKEKLSTQGEDPVSLDGSSANPNSFVSSLNHFCFLYVVLKLEMF